MPRARTTWQAYCYLSAWTDGSGGYDHGALEAWIARQELDAESEADVRRFVPVLIGESRAIIHEELERSRR